MHVTKLHNRITTQWKNKRQNPKMFRPLCVKLMSWILVCQFLIDTVVDYYL